MWYYVVKKKGERILKEITNMRNLNSKDCKTFIRICKSSLRFANNILPTTYPNSVLIIKNGSLDSKSLSALGFGNSLHFV